MHKIWGNMDKISGLYHINILVVLLFYMCIHTHIYIVLKVLMGKLSKGHRGFLCIFFLQLTGNLNKNFNLKISRSDLIYKLLFVDPSSKQYVMPFFFRN